MNTSSMMWTVMILLLVGCSDKVGNETSHQASGLEPLSYTVYTEKTEIFVEFKPLVVGNTSSFAAHFTILGEHFLPLTEGKVTVSLVIGENGIRNSASKVSSPGIFKLALKPTMAGKGKLIFDIESNNYSDQIVIENISVYPDESTALTEQTENAAPNSDEISYLKEQAWKVEFANASVKKQSFNNIIKTSGQILSAPGDEVIITSEINGIITFVGNNNIPGKYITAGSVLYKVKNSNLIENNVNADLKLAEETLQTAKLNFERSSELVKDKIISQNDFLQAKLSYDNAKTRLDQFKSSRKYYSANQSITAPKSGYIKEILVTQGELVTIGQPLAKISQNEKLMLQSNISQKYFSLLSSISSANFKTTESEDIYNTVDLNGKVISFGKSATPNSPFIPITFEINNIGKLISGSVAEVFLKSFPIPNALIIPATSLVEEQGNFFVYVQTGGESFQKREVKLGATDGINVQVLSGIIEGERVVTKGAYQIKLSTASGTMPAHGHEH